MTQKLTLFTLILTLFLISNCCQTLPTKKSELSRQPASLPTLTTLTEPFYWCSSINNGGPQFCFQAPRGTTIEKSFLENKFIPVMQKLQLIFQDQEFLKIVAKEKFLNYLKHKGEDKHHDIHVSGEKVVNKLKTVRLLITLGTRFSEGKVNAWCKRSELKLTFNIYRIYRLKERKLCRTVAHEIFHLLQYHHPKTPNKRNYLPYTLGDLTQKYFEKKFHK